MFKIQDDPTPPLTSHAFTLWHGVVDLSGDCGEARARIKMLTNGVLVEGFDFCYGHALFFKVIKGGCHQCFADSLSLVFGQDGEVGYAAYFAFMVDARGDVGRDFAIVFPNEDAIGIGGDVRVYVFGFARFPICVGKLTEVFFDVLVNRYPIKADDGDFFEGFEVFRAVFSDHGIVLYVPMRTRASVRRIMPITQIHVTMNPMTVSLDGLRISRPNIEDSFLSHKMHKSHKRMLLERHY